MRRLLLLLALLVLAAPVPAQDGERPQNGVLTLDALVAGSVGTTAADSEVTHSAAATAFACGIKSCSGAIAVDEERCLCRTLLEAAEARSLTTGLVVTSRVTHATPAAFAASRAGVGWTTLGHTGVDVLLYRFGPGAERLAGHLDNDAVGRILFDLMGLEPSVAAEPLGSQ